MTMARRRKTLRKRVYTYEQLDAKGLRWTKKTARSGSTPLYGDDRYAPLYGSVRIWDGEWPYWLRMQHGKKRIAPGVSIRYKPKRMDMSLVLAYVYRAADGATLYVVPGLGKSRNKKPEVRQRIAAWKRLVPAFTPHDGSRLLQHEYAMYLLKDGQANRLDKPVPIWLSDPKAWCWDARAWKQGEAHGNNWGRLYPLFPRRCLLFATRLRKALQDGPACEVQLTKWHGWGDHWGGPKGNSLTVCTPPAGGRDGRSLTVHIAMHSSESRSFHNVDGDYGCKHCQFFAGEGMMTLVNKKLMRWKCRKDAIVGIQEWVLGCIHIPGPG
jgi:hypothetical protein